MSTTKKRILNGFFAGVFGQIVNVIIQFVSVPLFLYFWGIDTYGDWLVLTSFVSFLSLSNLGFGAVSGNDMTIAVARGDRADALVTFQSMLLLTLLISLLCSVSVSMLFVFSPLISWLPIGSMTPNQGKFVLIFSTISVFIGQFNGIVSNGFRCDGNFATGSVLASVGRLFTWIIQMSTLGLTKDPSWIVVVGTIATLLWTFFMGGLLVRLSPWIKIGFENASIRKVKALASPAVSQLAFPLGDALNNQGMLQIVASVFGSSYAALFSMHRTLANATYQFLNLINHSLIPELSRLHGSEDLAMVRKLHRVSCIVAFWGAFLSGLGLLALSPWILDYWTVGRVSIDLPLMTGCVMVVVCRSLWLTSSAVFYSCNKHGHLARFYLLVVLISIIVTASAVSMAGRLAVPFVMVFSELVMVIFVTPRSISFVKDTYRGFAASFLKPRYSSRGKVTP